MVTPTSASDPSAVLANRSMWEGYREMVPALLRQLKYEDYFLKRELPPTARPYRETRIGGAPAAAE